MDDLNKIIIPINIDEPDLFNLYNAGTTLKNKYFYCSKTDSKIYIFEYVISGKGSIICGGKLYPVEAGNFYIVPKERTYEYFTDADDPYERMWFYGEGKLFDMLYNLCFNDIDVAVSKGDYTCIFGKLFDIFTDYTTSSDIELSKLFTELFITAKQLQTQNYQIHDKNVKNKASKIKNYICTHFDEKFDLASMAEKFDTTKNQIIIDFKRAYGTTPYVFSTMYKLDMAEEMLKRGLTNKEIADQLGYCDEKHLSRLFIKHKKTYPKLVKQRYNK